MTTTVEDGIGSGDARREAAQAWLRGATGDAGRGWAPVQGDASFRRYFRVRLGDRSFILMDAPPERERCEPFLDVARRLRAAGLHAPRVFDADPEAGFLLLEDLGDALYRDLLSDDTVEDLFSEALAALAVMARDVPADGLPVYDEGLFARELDWFIHYYLETHRGFEPDAAWLGAWRSLCARLLANAGEQPQVFVHKDVHSCNLLKTERDSPGIIDFQDAVLGPITYDFASLVWDRYQAWPRRRVEAWMERFRRAVRRDIDAATWRRWCDWTGLQRNLKIVGRFALLRHAQGKQGYVEMIPRFYDYVLDALGRYPDFEEMRQRLEDPRCAP